MKHIMSLENKIMEDLKQAMKDKDKTALESLRSIKSAILLAKTQAGAAAELSAEDEIKLVQRLVKQRRESAEIFAAQNRPELAENELAQAAVIEKFLPAQLDDRQLAEIIKALIAEMGVTSPAEMGKVIGAANKKLAGQAEGRKIADTVKAVLGGKA